MDILQQSFEEVSIGYRQESLTFDDDTIMMQHDEPLTIQCIDTDELLVIQHIDTTDEIMHRLSCLDEDVLISFIGDVLSKHAEKKQLFIPPDYISLSLSAMKQLECCGRSNLLYGLAFGLGTERADGSDALFPTKRVITGLLEYSVNFYNSGSASKHVSFDNYVN